MEKKGVPSEACLKGKRTSLKKRKLKKGETGKRHNLYPAKERTGASGGEEGFLGPSAFARSALGTGKTEQR